MKESTQKLLSYLNVLGKSINIKHFDSRLEAQKFAFILGEVVNGEPFYDDFNFYLKGPYSHQLAIEYFVHHQEFANPEKIKPVAGAELRELERIQKLIMSLDPKALEIVASLLYLKKREGLDEDAAEARLHECKPHFSMEDIWIGMNTLKALLLTDKARDADMKAINEEFAALDRASEEALKKFL